MVLSSLGANYLITPHAVVNLGVSHDLTIKTLIGIVPASVVVKLVSSLGGAGSAGSSCANSGASGVNVRPSQEAVRVYYELIDTTAQYGEVRGKFSEAMAPLYSRRPTAILHTCPLR